MPVIPVFRRWRQENRCKFKARLRCMVRPHLKKPKAKQNSHYQKSPALNKTSKGKMKIEGILASLDLAYMALVGLVFLPNPLCLAKNCPIMSLKPARFIPLLGHFLLLRTKVQLSKY